MRLGFLPERAAERNEDGSEGSESGSAGCSPLIASSNSARSSTLRAIGPCTVRLRSILNFGECATRPMLGRRPTTPQKLAGLRQEPPMSVPCASQAMPVASATAAPPEEPAADLEVSHGLSVAPNTSLKVCALAGRFLHQGSGVSPGAVEAEDRQCVDLRIDLADPLFQRVEQIERRDLAALEPVDDCASGFPHQSLVSQCRLSICFASWRRVASRCRTFSDPVATSAEVSKCRRRQMH